MKLNDYFYLEKGNFFNLAYNNFLNHNQNSYYLKKDF